MIIGEPRVSIEDGRAILFSDLRFRDGTEGRLWFSVEQKYADFLDRTTSDPFLIALIMVAMERKEDISVQGALTSRMFYNMSNYVQHILLLLKGERSPIRIEASDIISPKQYRADGVGTGFSGGVDSFATLHDHIGSPCPQDYRLTHLFFNNAGHIYEQDFELRTKYAREVAREFDMDLLSIKSNLNEFYTTPFPTSHSLRNAACVSIVPHLIGRYYYSSAFQYRDIRPNDAFFIGNLDPLLIHLLSGNQIDFVAVGGQYTRTEKTRLVAELPAAHKYLNVCIAPDTTRNCSVCAKCGRTLLTLEMFGVADRFKESFDLAKWRATRNSFVGEYILNRKKQHDPFVRELLDLADRTGTHFSPKERLLGHLAAILPQAVYDRIAKHR